MLNTLPPIFILETTFSDYSLLVFLTFGILLAGSAACLSSLGLLCILRKFHLQTFLAQEFFPPICHSLAVDTMDESCPKRQCWTRFEGRLLGFSPFMEQQNARGHLYDALFWAIFSYSPLFPSWANGSWPPLGTTGNDQAPTIRWRGSQSWPWLPAAVWLWPPAMCKVTKTLF